jgi:nucleotidyltransferase-like protein
MDRLLQEVCTALTRDSHAHTILLYGSRADGTETEFSDYDIAAFADVPVTKRDTRIVDGQFLDVFLHPQAVLRTPSKEHLTLRGSEILLQRGTEAADFLASIDALFHRGPEPLPADEVDARRTWARKMALRMRRGDIEGDFRRVWLLTALLEDYFALRDMWYQGPKKSFQWLRASDVRTYRAFKEALKPNASFDAIDDVVALVVGIPGASDHAMSVA